MALNPFKRASEISVQSAFPCQADFAPAQVNIEKSNETSLSDLIEHSDYNMSDTDRDNPPVPAPRSPPRSPPDQPPVPKKRQKTHDDKLEDAVDVIGTNWLRNH